MVKKTVDVIADLRKLVAGNKLVFGSEVTVKLLRQGKVKKIFFASNCNSQVKDDISQFCKVGEVECVGLPQSNEEIGVLCKKPFAISVFGVTA